MSRSNLWPELVTTMLETRSTGVQLFWSQKPNVTQGVSCFPQYRLGYTILLFSDYAVCEYPLIYY